jgi:hypothetical protein
MRWLLLAALAGCDPYDVCDAVTETPLPARLSATGIDGPDVRPYTPAFARWSDGAEKRRWLYLPPGGVIDTTDPDDWEFPIGTKAWKEFSRDNTRVETRLLQRMDDGTWAGVAYAWADDESDAVATIDGATDARGTPHDIPGAGACTACHGGRASHLLGVSAIQLAHDASPGELALADLIAGGRLSDPPATPPIVPGDDTVRAALGYLHANCSHCHNQSRPARTGARCYDPDNDLDFQLKLGALATPAQTGTYRTVVGEKIERGAPDSSRVVELMKNRGGGLQMPPLATERRDDAGIDTIRTWIRDL